jgi:hypothetical protein
MLRTALSKILAAKAVAAVVLLAGATGGVALAATVSNGSDAPPADRPAATRTATPSSAANPSSAAEHGSADRTKSADPTATESPTASAAAPAPPANPDPSLTGLCNAWSAGATDNPGKAADNPAFSALVKAAGSPEKVEDYCATLKDDGARGANHERPAGQPTDVPGAAHPTGQPTAAPGNPDHPAGPPADAPKQNGATKNDGSASGSDDHGTNGS